MRFHGAARIACNLQGLCLSRDFRRSDVILAYTQSLQIEGGGIHPNRRGMSATCPIRHPNRRGMSATCPIRK